ncbi:Pro-Pol polyprotein [Stylophora pistillata]|uniref:Pro-Pol polyprotein n=1 Tax=Stylophora pistillata TaxID=50429 RepID=A0A2B4S3Q9_STYPI|nr:Pro-Pol polyprotein [Stylophora pistillata]
MSSRPFNSSTSVKFTMEVEKNSKLPFLGTELLNHAPRIETKVYVKPTNTGLLLHYQSHVDNRYKRSLLKTMLDRAHRLSSSWAHFSDECDRLKKVFARLKYPERLVNSTINTFLQSRIVGTQPTQTPKEPISIVRVVIPFKDQESANHVKKELKNLSMKVQTTVQPVFVSRKVGRDLKVREIKPQIVNLQRVVYRFRCDLCDAGYVGYTRADGHKRKASSIYKHYHERHSEVPKDLLKRFSILKECSKKFDCLVNEMLFIRDLKPTLNVQSDSIRQNAVYRPGIDNVPPDTLYRARCATTTCPTKTEDSFYMLHEFLCHPGVTILNHFVQTKNLPKSLEKIRDKYPVCFDCKTSVLQPVVCSPYQGHLAIKGISIDFKGPLQTNTSNAYFLMVVDEYSRFPFVFPFPDVLSSTVIKCLTSLFPLGVGMPAYVHSDRGASFMSKEFRDFLTTKGVATSRTRREWPSGVPMANGVLWKTITISLKFKNVLSKN